MKIVQKKFLIIIFLVAPNGMKIQKLFLFLIMDLVGVLNTIEENILKLKIVDFGNFIQEAGKLAVKSINFLLTNMSLKVLPKR